MNTPCSLAFTVPCLVIFREACVARFDSRWERCIYQASRPLQGTVNGGAVSKWLLKGRKTQTDKQTNKLVILVKRLKQLINITITT